MTRPRFPWLTLAVTVITAGFFAWQQVHPGLVQALQRDPAGLQWSNCYRVLTAMLIQSDGWGQAVFNLISLVFFGVVVEWVRPRWAWLALYLGAGVVGQLLGYAWEPPGGGNSVAVCGLVGAVITMMLLGRPEVPMPARIFAAYYPAALLGQDRGALTLAIVATAVVVTAVILLGGRAPERQLRLWRGLGALLAVEAAALTALQNHHGPALLMGMALGALLREARVPAPSL